MHGFVSPLREISQPVTPRSASGTPSDAPRGIGRRLRRTWRRHRPDGTPSDETGHSPAGTQTGHSFQPGASKLLI
jgi:hypothetical protein